MKNIATMVVNGKIVQAVEKFEEVVRETVFCYRAGLITSHEYTKSVVKSYEDIVMPVLGEDLDLESDDSIFADTAFENALFRGFMGDEKE